MKKIEIFCVVLLLVLTGVYVKNNMNRSVKICAAGDILLSRGVGKKIDEKGYDYPYEEVNSRLAKADIAFANLECPITQSSNYVYKRRDLLFRADTENGGALKKAGFDILSLANNHSMDCGHKGIVDTINILNDNEIIPVGAGQDYDNARKPVFIKKNGCTIGFLAYCVFPPEGYVGFDDKPDVARIDKDKLKSEIEQTKKDCDFLVMSIHWGKEFEFFPRNIQKEIAHMAVDGGADVVIGHHPHVLQGIDKYKGKFIFYSLGNFVFDKQIQKGTDETVILDLTLKDNKIKGVKIIPIKIIDCQPNIAKGEVAEYILNRLKLYSKDFDINIKINNDVGYVR